MMQQHRLIDEHKRKGTADSLKINIIPRVTQPAGREESDKMEAVKRRGKLSGGPGLPSDKEKPQGRGQVAVADTRSGRLLAGLRGSAAARRAGSRRHGPPAAPWLAALAVLALALLLPALLTWRAAAPATPPDPAAAQAAEPGPRDARPAAPPAPPADVALADGVPVRVHLTRTGKIETVPLEQYVTGVLAAEMPADFELAALKAQAIAARTYIVRRLAMDETGDMAGKAADVNDTTAHQAYLSRVVLMTWPKQGKAAQLAKLQEAVRQTEGIVMTFRGQPITAAFFSSSGGHTENSEEYWSLKVPYLRSVASPWDAEVHPESKETIEMPLAQLYRKLGQPIPKTVQSAIAAFAQGEGGKEFKLKADKLFQTLSWTTGRRVKEFRIGDKTYSGRELREKLELRSSQFTLALDGDKVKITTYGYGHGVGMSQWGANGMARQGFTTTQILKHYYTGIDFGQASSFLEKI
ncbi:stage II sporulation protein D [Paenibacillus sanguinis]|uniref:stage II sporulation protein D n=1 Tax=Paenibacillus sanguinis TaxID=225906 RepID=UPI001F0AB8E1|nr:stage II sporulation protein D [Paenibacillus sanguinis]